MPTATPRALVVDDEKLVRLLAARALAAQRIICDTAEDGGVAEQLLGKTRYDVVITDLRMPRRNGHALCQSILDRSERPLLIVITGVSEPRLFRDLEARGVDAILRKPIDFVAFGRQIRSMIDERAAARRGPDDAALMGAGSAPTAAPPIGAPRLPTVAILMRQRERAQDVATELGPDTVNTFVADTTDSLCRFVEDQRVDVILIENVQYGFLNGAAILGHLQNVSIPPQAIVIGATDAFSVEQIQSLNIRKIFPPEATDSDLVQSIRSVLVNSGRANRISAEARALVKPFKSPAYSPAVLLSLTKYLELPPGEIPLVQLSRDIMSDPPTTAELLRLVNGSSVGMRRQVTEISEALNFLGAGRAVALLVSSGIRNVEGNLLRKLPVDVRAWYQLRTILIASVSSVFAERHFALSGDTAFVLGLFQDIGILVLANAYGDRYLKLIEHARSMGPVRLHAIEQQALHVNHAEVSAALVELWRLPDKLIRPIREHHDAVIPGADRKESLAFLQPMHMGEAFADLWDNRHPSRSDAMSRYLAECPRGQHSDYQESLAEAVRKTAEVASLFMLPLPDEDESLAVCKGILAAYSDFPQPEAIAPQDA